MSKIILVTGSTDGIGLITAKMLVEEGHKVIVHGRSVEKVKKVLSELISIDENAKVDGFIADFSNMKQVKSMAEEVRHKYNKIDVLINNAGVFMASNTITVDNLDLRFAVNTIAPYLLTKLLLPIMDNSGRIINLSSAAQAPVNIGALAKATRMTNDSAYAQSKLGITMWSNYMANDFINQGNKPLVVSVNPKSFLASKMVKEAYGSDGHDIRIGGDILCRLALLEEFADASGKYFDNDRGIFAMPHPDALDEERNKAVVDCIENILAKV